MEEIVTYQSYKEYKAELDTELQKSAEGFVRIGYLLKLARDTDVLKESGYASVNEFAQAEYNIDKSMVSRFIGINDRFSEGGNSPQLKEQYRNFGYAKLAIMLQLPDSINEELSPAFSKTEIQAIKEEYDSEMKKTDLEVLMEEKPEGQQDMEDDLSKAVRQLGYDNPELYKEIYRAIAKEDSSYKAPQEANGYKALQEALAPAGEGICSIRIPGTGRMLLSIKGIDSDITLTNIRTGEKKGYTWESLHRAAWGLVRIDSRNAEESWIKVYMEPFPVEKEPEKPKVAPVQQKKEDKKPKKQPKVIKAKVKEKPVNTQWEETEQKEGSSREDKTEKETKPSSCGALDETESAGSETVAIENVTEISEIVTETPCGIQKDQPESEMPESENVTVEPENGAAGEKTELEPEKVMMSKQLYKARRKDYIRTIGDEITLIQSIMEKEFFIAARDKMEAVMELLGGLIRLEEENEAYKEDDEDADEQ